MGSLKQTLWWVRSSVCVCVPEAHSMQMVGPWGRYLPCGYGRPAKGVAPPEAHSMQMVGPWGRYLPQWLRAPCKGSGPARSTQYADGRTLG